MTKILIGLLAFVLLLVSASAINAQNETDEDQAYEYMRIVYAGWFELPKEATCEEITHGALAIANGFPPDTTALILGETLFFEDLLSAKTAILLNEKAGTPESEFLAKMAQDLNLPANTLLEDMIWASLEKEFNFSASNGSYEKLWEAVYVHDTNRIFKELGLAENLSCREFFRVSATNYFGVDLDASWQEIMKNYLKKKGAFEA